MSSDAAAVEGSKETRRRETLQRAIYALAAFLSLLGAIRYGFQLETLVVGFVISVLVVISRHDLERRIIPNRIVVPAWITVLLAHVAIHPHQWLEWVGGSLGAGAFFLVVLLAYPAGLGMGDVKLALLIGAALGWSVIAALLLGTLAAGVVSAGMLVANGSAVRKREIPLGPFLAAGAIIVLLFL
jgi:leader peptidase (prepilin peptidase) / N-methyltransferase